MEDDRDSNGSRGWQEVIDDVERIEDRGLNIGKKRRAQEEVRIPKWQTTFADCPRRFVSVGIEVGLDVVSTQHESGKGEFPIEAQGQCDESRERQNLTGCARGIRRRDE